MRHPAPLFLASALALAACGKTDAPDAPANAVLADGPAANIQDVAATDLPQGARDAALAKVPGLSITEVERKARGGLVFYDVEGKRPDGSEIELDMIEEAGKYRVVELQRDIPWTDAPAPVRAAAAKPADAFDPVRVIESTQNDGTIVYELFAKGKPAEPTAEVNWKDGKATLRAVRNEY